MGWGYFKRRPPLQALKIIGAHGRIWAAKWLIMGVAWGGSAIK